MTRNRRRRGEALRQRGSSIPEVLVGFFILLLVLIGLLPIFTRAVGQNLAGMVSTEMTTHGGTRLESLMRLGFNNWELRVASGSFRSTTDFWSRNRLDYLGDEEWVADPAGELAKWRRTTEVRQFGIHGVRDSDGDGVIDTILGLEDLDRDGRFDHALPAGTAPSAIHLKEVRVHLLSTSHVLGSGSPAELTLSSLKAF